MGNLFLLSQQQYLGTPRSLSAATAGFLGSSTSAAGGIYQFNPTLILMDITQYFAYTDALVPVSGAFSDAYPAGTACVANIGTSGYTQFLSDADFRLSGIQAASAVPLLGTLALFGIERAALVVTQRRRAPFNLTCVKQRRRLVISRPGAAGCLRCVVLNLHHLRRSLRFRHDAGKPDSLP